MYRILIVEDEQAIARAVAEELSHWGLESRCVENFRDVMAEFQAFQPQLVLLDIMLPFFNGYHWCNEIRKCSNAPIIFLSSASDNMNIVMAAMISLPSPLTGRCWWPRSRHCSGGAMIFIPLPPFWSTGARS